MNRQIKFRAWVDNSYIKEMHYPNEIQINSPDAKAFQFTVGFFDAFPEQNDITQWQKDIVWMQFTGLHDKNGKEIYEGDICTFYNKYNKTTYTRVVRFCPMFACFALYPNMTEEWQYECDWLKIEDVTIIGNIFEHPDLIK